MGKTLVVKGQIVGKYKYDNKNIENLILEEGLLYIEYGAFEGNNIKKLYLPKSVKKVNSRAFDFNPLTEIIFYNNGIKFDAYCLSVNVKKITIIDCDYKYLYNFIMQKIGYYNWLHVKEINIVNDKLNFIEKLKMKYFASIYPNIKINILQDINLDEFIKQETSIEDVDDEINILLSEIYSMIKYLDGVTKQTIVNKINSLINEYQTKLENSKPQFNIENNPSLIFEDISPKTLRNNLIYSLEMIIQNLITKGKIIKLSEKIGKYLHYLLGNEINVKDDEIFIKIKEIVNIAKIIEENKYVNILKELFEKINKIILDNFNDEYVINLTLRNFDIETYFEEKLDKIYNEVMTLNSRLNPYLELLKVLKGYENDTSLAQELRKLERVFSELVGKANDELYNEYQELKKKYINILNENILKIKNNQLDALSIAEIELNFRKELQPILEKLNALTPLILKNQKLYHQFSIASSESEENGSIIDLIKEIRKLVENNFLSSDVKDTIIDKLSHIIIHWENILLSKDTREIVKNFSSEVGLKSENLILEVMILKDLYELKFSVEQYIVESQEYDKAISSAGTISVDNHKSEIKRLKELKAKIQDDRPSNISKKYLKEDHKCLDLINIEPDSNEYKELMRCIKSLY